MKLSKKTKILVCVMAVVAVASIMCVIVSAVDSFTIAESPRNSANFSIYTDYSPNIKTATTKLDLRITGKMNYTNGVATRTAGYYMTDGIPVNYLRLGDWYIGDLSALDEGVTYRRIYKYHLTDGSLPSSYDVVIQAHIYSNVEKDSGVFPDENYWETIKNIYSYKH